LTQPQGQTVRNGIIAAALLTVEFIAGMQTYVLRTVIPIVGTTLHAHEYYGVITGIAQITMFLTMPLGPYLLQRFRVGRVLLHLTVLSIVGGVISAAAPSVGIFVLGRAITGLASGAMSTVSLSTIVTVLPAAWRRTVLAGYNVMWLCTSLVGPLYAGWVASALSWRWALVLYLPLLILARIAIAHQLKGSMQPSGNRERLTLGSAFVLAGGVTLLTLVGLEGLPAAAAVALAGVGTAVALLAARRLLPAGTLSARPGRPAAVATMGLVTGSYFGAAAIMAIVVHDLLHGTTGDVALVLAGSGLAWAVTGLVVSRWPAQADRAYVNRSALGAGVLAVGLLMTGAALVGGGTTLPVGLVLIGWTLAGVGMGLIYLDTLNRIVDVPPAADGVSAQAAAASAILVEAVATAVVSTLAAAVVGRADAGGGGKTAAAGVLVLTVVIAASVAGVARRVAADTPVEDQHSQSGKHLTTRR
jgi:MFS family permease